MYWAIKRLWFPAAVHLLWWGGRQIDWPRPLQLAGCVLAMLVISSSAQYLTYATRHLEDGYRWVEITVLSVGWFLSLVIVVLLTIKEPLVGIVGGAFLIYTALNTFREQRDAVIRKLRFEGVALRRDDPRWKPAVQRDLWPRKHP